MEPLITVKHLTKSFKQYKKESGLAGSIKSIFKREYIDIKAVQDVSFEIQPGEFVGFIGPNGAGKTTTLKMLSGLLYPSSGHIKVMEYTPWERKREYLKQISLVMGQKNQLWWDLPPIDSFALNKEIYQISDHDYKKRVAELTEILEISDILNIQVRKLSLGQRMKCELAASLLHAPKVIFLDEPTIGLDVVMQKKLRAFFKEYNERYNTTIMLTSHYMDDVKELCKRVIIINSGKVIYDGNLKELVHKYVHHKNITFALNREVLREDIEGFGNITEFDGMSATISIPREEIPHVSAAILQKLPVEDLDIKEIGLDEVVRMIFREG